MIENCDQSCNCNSARLPRRAFLKLTGAASASLSVGSVSMAGPFQQPYFENLVPSDKKLNPEWVRSLAARGKPEIYRSMELEYIGMPVGGIACGQLYLGGNGKLWYWDIFKSVTSTDYQNQAWAGHKYKLPISPKNKGSNPAWPDHMVEHGFCIQVHDGDKSYSRPLDSKGFPDISFRGEYPIGRVTYKDDQLPVEVKLEAFSPFIPLNVDDSSIPCTILSFDVKNTSERNRKDGAGDG